MFIWYWRQIYVSKTFLLDFQENDEMDWAQNFQYKIIERPVLNAVMAPL